MSYVVPRALHVAARPGAKLLVVDTLVPDGSAPHAWLELDMLMMCVTGGRERTGAEVAGLMSSSGWRVDNVIFMSGPSVILEGAAV